MLNLPMPDFGLNAICRRASHFEIVKNKFSTVPIFNHLNYWFQLDTLQHFKSFTGQLGPTYLIKKA